MDRRFTPAEAHASSSAGFTASGLASSVTSASDSSSKCPQITFQARVKWRADSADGLPPPKNTERKRTPAACGAREAASRSSAESQRSTPAPEKRSFEKWQYGQGAAQNGTCK